MEFEKFPVIMQRYSFEAIMNKCAGYARRIMSVHGVDVEKAMKNRLPFPWELEVIVLFGLMIEKKYDFREFKGKHKRDFTKMVNCVREYEHPDLKNKMTLDWVNKYTMATGLIQFSVQEEFRHKLYRYHYYFTFQNEKVNMKKLFEEFFGTPYFEFVVLVLILYTLYSSENFFNQSVNPLERKILEYIMNKYHLEVKQLLISRKEFIKIQSLILKGNINNYYYSFKYFYQYPFIEHENKIFLPLPYLLNNAITDSLLYRLTQGNNGLRDLIGKEVMENYLYDLLTDSMAYDEICKERSYTSHGTQAYSPDVLVRKNNCCILFDSKASAPLIALREFEVTSIEKMIQRYSEAIAQMYKQIQNFDLFNPFEHDFDNNNVFGVIVIYQDSNIFRKRVYEKTAQMLELEPDTYEYQYLQSNILILTLSDIERFSLTSNNFISGLISRRDDRMKWNDLTVNNEIYSNHSSTKKLSDFLSDCRKRVFAILGNFDW